MIHADALALSADLATEGLSHTVSVGCYPDGVQALVTLVGHSWRWDRLLRARELGGPYGVELEYGAAREGFSFVSPTSQAIR